jgi:hypothetical protein
MLYVLYMAPLFNVNADDMQLYLCVPLAEAAVAADRLGACLVDVEAWLKASQLRLNPSKTQVMWLGSAQQLAKVQLDEIPVFSSQVSVVPCCKEPRIVVDSQLSMSAPVSAVCRGGYTISYGSCDHSRGA